MDLTVPVPVETDKLPLLQGCVVRDDLVIDDPEYSDGEMTGGAYVSAETWCQGRPEIGDDSSWQCVVYVGCDPDCVYQLVPKDNDGNPFRTMTLLYEPLLLLLMI